MWVCVCVWRMTVSGRMTVSVCVCACVCVCVKGSRPLGDKYSITADSALASALRCSVAHKGL